MSVMSGQLSLTFCSLSIIIKIRSIILQQRCIIRLQGVHVSGSVSKYKNKIIWTKIKLLKKLVSGRKKAITAQMSFFLKPSQVAMFWYIKPTYIKFYETWTWKTWLVSVLIALYSIYIIFTFNGVLEIFFLGGRCAFIQSSLTRNRLRPIHRRVLSSHKMLMA